MFIPKVCVCVPCYNNEDTIERTLKSIFEQTYKNYDVLIIDNCSTDGTIDKIYKVVNDNKQFAGEVTIIHNDENIGGRNNWNKCIENSHGDFMCLFHADDVYLPTIVEKQAEFMAMHNDVGIVFTNADIIDADDNIVCEHLVPQQYVHKGLLGFDAIYDCFIQYGNIIIAPSGMYRISVLRKYNYKFTDNFKYGFDMDFFIEVGKKNRLAFLGEKLIKYRLYNSASASFRIALNYKYTLIDDFTDVIRAHIIKEGMSYKLNSIEYVNICNKRYKENMIKAFLNGDYAYAREMLNKFDRRVPYKKLWLWKILINSGLPECIRKYMVYKRYKKFFKGKYSDIVLRIEE